MQYLSSSHLATRSLTASYIRFLGIIANRIMIVPRSARVISSTPNLAYSHMGVYCSGDTNKTFDGDKKSTYP